MAVTPAGRPTPLPCVIRPAQGGGGFLLPVRGFHATSGIAWRAINLLGKRGEGIFPLFFSLGVGPGGVAWCAPLGLFSPKEKRGNPNTGRAHSPNGS